MAIFCKIQKKNIGKEVGGLNMTLKSVEKLRNSIRTLKKLLEKIKIY
jgi:hypothetical protein